MRAFSDLIRYLSALTFTGLTVVAWLGWRRQQLEQGRWAVLTFGALAAVTVHSAVGDVTGAPSHPVLERALILVLVGFPYFLYRFTTSFADRRPFARPALAITLLVAAATIVLPSAVSGRTTATSIAFLALFLTQWSFLAFIGGLELWRAGVGQPTVARRRMRTLSLGATGMVIALLTAVATSAGAPPAARLVVQLLALVSGVLFFLGFAPPSVLRLWWRQPEQQALQEAMLGLMRSMTVKEVTDALLPRVAGMVGAERVDLLDEQRTTVISHERAPVGAGGLPPERDRRHCEDVPLSSPMGVLRVWTSPYTPFFGRDEIRVLHALGAIADLALGRTRVVEEERRVRDALERANQELTSANQDLAREVTQRQRAEQSLISQTKELVQAREEAERANTAKSDFLSRMSHELRTPLNAILGFGQLLEMEELEPSQRESVTQVLKAGRHLLGLINEVLEISRIEAGLLTISSEPVSVTDVLGEAIDMARPLSSERGIEIDDVDLDGDHVLADRQRLKQVLLNLLSNAIKYNREGGSVSVSSERAGSKLRIAVRDTGPGIPEDKMGRLFTPFERLGAEGSDIQGTGLGLALSKSLMEVMGGDLWVDSTPGQGSVFTIELPLGKRPSLSSDGTGRSPQASEDRLPTGATVLYIEDNTSNLRLVEQVLTLHSSARVFTAMQGRMGLDLARRHRPDIILLDLHLPDMGGEDVLRRLRADERTREIPVVMVSADATAGSVRKLKEQGATDYITKPLDIGRFLDVLAENLAARVG